MKPVVELVFLCCTLAFAGCQSIPSVLREDAEFGAVAREAKGRYLGVAGYSVSLPGVSGTSGGYSSKEVFVIPGTSDFWRTEAERNYIERAWKFAEKYNLWVQANKRPNKAPEPTPTSVTPPANSR